MQEIQQALETMHRTIQAALAKVSTLKKAANMMASGAGLPEPYDDVDIDARGGAAFRLRPDQFHSEKAPASAARSYLGLRGKDRGATTIDDIYDALARGGYDFGGIKEPEAKQNLRIALAKDGKVHKLPNGYIGLREWYGIADEEKVSSKKTDKPTERPVEKTEESAEENEAEHTSSATNVDEPEVVVAKKKRGRPPKSAPNPNDKTP